MRTLPLTVLAVLSLAAAPGVAHAGGCTPCASSAECVAMFGAPAFCIHWDDSTGGCAGTPIQCCPGQGCSAVSGRPSCESEGRCHVIDEDGGVPGTDAGATGTDAGSGGVDAGGGGVDAGSAGVDAGSSPMDAGSSGMDAGTGGGTSRGGCACGVGHPGSPEGAGLLALAFGALVLHRRRSR